MRLRILSTVLLLLLAGSLLSYASKTKVKDLNPRFREFLNLAHYIMLDQERDVFMKLENDRERDIFVRSFWKQRDPTPGTPENEYKDEIIERFKYANKYLGRETPKDGWRTARGMMYIILGPPDSKENFVEQKGIYPSHVWYYYGDTAKGLPPHFALVFFQRGGIGEFKLYDPMSDGPSSLLIDSRHMDPFNYQKLYEKILETAPTLANVSLSLIPGEVPYSYIPSTRNAILIKDIMQAPTKDVNPSYATHFLNYRGMVDTEYMTNYLESDTLTELIWDPILRLNFLHFSIAPKTVSVDYYEPKDQYFSNYTMDVSLRKDDEVFFQYSKNFPFYFPADDMNKIEGNGLVVEDSFPVVEGTYELDVLLRNSVGKEFTLLEQVIKIEEVTDSPQIMGPFLGHDVKTYDGDVHIPYKVLNKKLVVDPRQIFSTSDSVSFLFILSNIDRELWEGGKVEIFIEGAKQQSKPKSLTMSLNSNLFKNTLVMNHTVSAQELPPDYYELWLRLVDKERTLVDEKFNNFTVSFQETLSHPITRMKAFPRAHDYVYLFMVARQYSKTNNDEKAQVYYKRAVEMNPDYKKGLIEYAQFLLRLEQYAECLGLIERVKDDEEFKFDYYLIKGRMYMGMEMYSRAIENFIEGNKIYNSNITLLNSLGYSYYKTGEKEKALEALKASLKLNTEQKDIQELVKKLEESSR